MNRHQIEEAVIRALNMVYSRDAALLSTDSAEWSVAHRLAVYLEHEMPDWNVDCEFNRQGTETAAKRNSSGDLVRPDIVVHHRGRLELAHNLLAVEVKKSSSEEDREKVCEYTKPPTGERPFQYQFGITVVLNSVAQLTWYTDGKQLKPEAE